MIEQDNKKNVRKIMKRNQSEDPVKALFETLSMIKDPQEMARFMRDLCTPQEIAAFAERWRVCQLLNEGDLSYREIHDITGASLATITRVARFLKDEPHHGYRSVLKKIK
jgi:TrpR-related protein YerC/YecD